MEGLGLAVWRRAASGRLSDLVDILAEAGVIGDSVAFQLYGELTSEASGAIVALGAEVTELATYLWNDPVEEGPALRLAGAVVTGRVDAVSLTSAPAVGRLGLLIRELTDALARRRPLLMMPGQQVVLQGSRAIVEGSAVALGGRERDVLASRSRRYRVRATAWTWHLDLSTWPCGSA